MASPPSPAASSKSSWWDTASSAASYIPIVGTVMKVHSVAAQAEKVLQQPGPFMQNATRGIVSGLSSPPPPLASLSAAATAPPSAAASSAPPGAASAPAALSSTSPTSALDMALLLGRITDLYKSGLSAGASAVMSFALNYATPFEMDPAVIAKAKTDLAGPTGGNFDTVKQVWKTLYHYHIIVGGVNTNINTHSDDFMREQRTASLGQTTNGVTPITSLQNCQTNWRTLRERYRLQIIQPSPALPSVPSAILVPSPPQAEDPNIKGLRDETNLMMKQFVEKSVNYATMFIIHQIVNSLDNPDIYKEHLNKENIQEDYLKRFSGFRKFLYRIGYNIIYWFIQPIIAPTIEQVVEHLRTFLNKDVDLLKLVEQKVRELSKYYGRIELGRKRYLDKKKREDECGTFDSFLEETIKVYGTKKLTKEQLVKIFGDYIVDNFVPSPKVRLWGYRIPVISSVMEWAGHAVRKSIVSHVLKKTEIVQKMLTQGTDSVHYAQLGLKQLLAQKLAQVCDIITRSRSLVVDPLDLSAAANTGEAVPAAALPMELQAKKAQIVTEQLHLAIKQQSSKLLDFIDIEACNGDDHKLRDLDNKVSHLVKDILTAVTNVFKMEPFSIRKVLEDASTHAMETALLSLFENKQEQIETQLKTIFAILDKSFEHIPEEARAAKEFQFRKECDDIDRNLTSLQKRLSETAVAAAIEKHLRSATTEKHQSIMHYVEQERIHFNRFVNQLGELSTELRTQIESADANSTHFKDHLSRTVSFIEQYLSHLTVQVDCAELKNCYQDVRGDLYNIYGAIIGELNRLHGQLSHVATAVDLMKTAEKEGAASRKCVLDLVDFRIEDNSEAAKQRCKLVQEALPESQRRSLNPSLDKITADSDRYAEQARLLVLFDRRTELEIRERALLDKQRLLLEEEEKLNRLKILCQAHNDSKRGTNLQYQDQSALRRGRREMVTQMTTLLTELRAVRDPDFQLFIQHQLKGDAGSSELYQVFFPEGFSFIPRQAPLFAELAAIKGRVQRELEQTRAQKAAIHPVPPPARETIISALDVLRRSITDNVQHVSRTLHTNAERNQAIIEEQKRRIGSAGLQGFHDTIGLLDQFKTHFNVSGCIIVGEAEFQNTISEKLVGVIAPAIEEGTRTMIQAMGKPFHYEQLVLRLLFLDIAERHTVAKN